MATVRALVPWMLGFVAGPVRRYETISTVALKLQPTGDHRAEYEAMEVVVAVIVTLAVCLVAGVFFLAYVLDGTRMR